MATEFFAAGLPYIPPAETLEWRGLRMPTFLKRLGAAVIAARQRAADREVARIIERMGGWSDTAEREIQNRMARADFFGLH